MIATWISVGDYIWKETAANGIVTFLIQVAQHVTKHSRGMRTADVYDLSRTALNAGLSSVVLCIVPLHFSLQLFASRSQLKDEY